MRIETYVHIQVILPRRGKAEMQMSTDMCHHTRTNAMRMDPRIHVSMFALHYLHKERLCRCILNSHKQISTTISGTSH